MTKRFAVFGNPVAHSLSPRIHQHFAAQLGITLSYESQLIALDDFESEVKAFFKAGGSGLNITLPFKKRAAQLASELKPRALEAQAANTLSLMTGNRFAGDNTDGAGLARDLLDNLGWTIQRARLLLIGAGGAAYGIFAALLEHKPSQVAIINRTVAKATALAEKFAGRGVALDAVALNDVHNLSGCFDLIINASSAGLETGPPLFEQLPTSLCATDASNCYDLTYGKAAQPFAEWARRSKAAQHSDGLGMLVEQAAESFMLWHGTRPNSSAILTELRREAACTSI